MVHTPRTSASKESERYEIVFECAKELRRRCEVDGIRTYFLARRGGRRVREPGLGSSPPISAGTLFHENPSVKRCSANIKMW